MQSSAIDLLRMISQKTNFIENWTLRKPSPSPQKHSSIDLKHESRSINTLAKMKHNKKESCCEIGQQIFSLDQSFKLKPPAPSIKNLAPIIRHRVYHKSIVSTLMRKRYREPLNNDSTCNTINLYECATADKKYHEENQSNEECSFSNIKILQSLNEKIKSPIKNQKIKQQKKRICSFNRYFQSCFINANHKKGKIKSATIQPVPQKELRATKLKLINPSNSKSLRKNHLSLDIL